MNFAVNLPYREMEFPAFEWIRITRKWNISAAREQWGLGQLKCSMGRMERYKRDAYHVGKHSRLTPRLAHVIFFLILLSSLWLILNHRRGRSSQSCGVNCYKKEWESLSVYEVLAWWLLKRAETFACGHRGFPPQRNQDRRSTSIQPQSQWHYRKG